MKLVTAEQMRSIDRETIDNQGIPGDQLMENAGRGIAERLQSLLIDASSGDAVAIFCGKGNNGGDGFVVGRYLYQAGAKVSIYFLGPLDNLSKDTRLNFDRAAGVGVDLIELNSIDDLPAKLETDCIIDAIFGTGFTGAMRSLTAELIDYINLQPERTIAIDLPSGVNADSGQVEGVAVQANHTFTLALPKYGLYVTPGREMAGAVMTVPIGIPEVVVDSLGLKVDLITPEQVVALIPRRKPDGHKGDFGKLFVLAGSTGMTGAAAMTAKSAFRSGCGTVKIGCPHTALPLIAMSILEATTWPLPDVAKKGALSLRALGEVRKLATQHDAVAVGPGIGTHHETSELIRRFIVDRDQPMVIDADGLNALVGHADILTQIKVPPVLTPHPGEFCRLSGLDSIPDSIHERIQIAQQFASKHQVILVLKGSPTIVADLKGDCFLNPTGNSGMATGGSGDVLTGVIGSFLAQGVKPLDAALIGVFVHGLAGDLAADQLTQRSVIAGDLIDFLCEVFETLGC